jgi:MoaA/NifB/PqqE/SkfB family radical SAM enzyme
MTMESTAGSMEKSARSSALVRLLKRVPQYTRMGRHALSVLRHSTPRKLANLALVEAEYRLRRTHVRGRPYILIVDPLNVCNLRCPLCPTGTGDLERHQGKMPWETFKKVIDEMAPYAYEVNLHNWGESLLHPNIFEMIEYVASKNVATNMSTNFNLVTDEKIDKLIRSGLEYLILSIDGTTNETYKKYRVRGNLDRVMANVQKLVQRRKELGSRTPYLEWQFIVFKHNAHEVDEARALAEKMGIDRFRVIPAGTPMLAENQDELRREWLIDDELAGEGESESAEEASLREVQQTSCFYLYRSFTTNPDGGTAPCCVVYGKHNDFGDVNTQTPREIWNNEKYISARSLFRTGGQATQPTICDGCTLFQKRGRPARIPALAVADAAADGGPLSGPSGGPGGGCASRNGS